MQSCTKDVRKIFGILDPLPPLSAFFCFSFDPPTLADVLSQLDPSPPRLDKNTLAFPKCNHRVSVCRVCSRLQPIHKNILMLENVKCGSHQKNGISLLGPENTKSDILKRTSKLARHPPPPCPHFSAFQVPPSPPLVRTSFMYGP